MKTPKLSKIDWKGTHRLIPYRYSDPGSLNLLARDDEGLLSDLTELEGATNDRLLGESGRLPEISAIELVSGFPLAHIVNASFTHANPTGGRFNSPGRGCWYAAVELETSQEEIAYHRSVWLKEVGWKEKEVSQYVDYLADFRHEFHDVCGDAEFAECLDPNSYVASQALGSQLLNNGSAGVVYPSVRHKGGTCVGCFRPPLVLNVQEGPMVRFTFVAGEKREVRVEEWNSRRVEEEYKK
jgi:RES domain-containing protein